MGTKVLGTKATRMFAARREAPGLAVDLADLVHRLAHALFDTYRPELHYMRGPGPKWHAKHDPAPEVMHHRAPVLARVRVKA
jgi:hypothetical protein